MKVMIVDDNDDIRAMIRNLLASSADTFCECSDGAEALERYTQCHPDWVLMDARMNEMDGFEATEQILASFPDAKIIMVTQFDEPSLKRRALQSGALAFVLKEKLIDVEGIMKATHN